MRAPLRLALGLCAGLLACPAPRPPPVTGEVGERLAPFIQLHAADGTRDCLVCAYGLSSTVALFLDLEDPNAPATALALAAQLQARPRLRPFVVAGVRRQGRLAPPEDEAAALRRLRRWPALSIPLTLLAGRLLDKESGYRPFTDSYTLQQLPIALYAGPDRQLRYAGPPGPPLLAALAAHPPTASKVAIPAPPAGAPAAPVAGPTPAGRTPARPGAPPAGAQADPAARPIGAPAAPVAGPTPAGRTSPPSKAALPADRAAALPADRAAALPADRAAAPTASPADVPRLSSSDEAALARWRRLLPTLSGQLSGAAAGSTRRLSRLLPPEGAAVVALWASFCPPCLAEAEHLMALHQRGRIIIGVNLDGPHPSAAARRWRARLPYPNLNLDPKSLGALEAIELTLPMTLRVERGEVTRLHRGAPSPATLEALSAPLSPSGR